MSVQKVLAQLPSVDLLLNHPRTQKLEIQYKRELIKSRLQESINAIRQDILADNLTGELTREELTNHILDKAEQSLNKTFEPSLKQVINATGIILHTGLGRAPYSQAAIENVNKVMQGYCNLELDMDSGKRGERTLHVEELLCELTGAEAALVVNNNAAAVFLSLNTCAFGKEAIISRGQLVEIGGSFRIPDVMKKSGCLMNEIGTTNKTKLADYQNAISDKTGAIVVAHTSNYRVIGFTAEVDLEEIAQAAQNFNIPLIHDLGAGVIVDFKQFSLPSEPLVQDSIKAGADVVTFSGDKVLGGPQCGIIVGKKEWLKKIHKNPIMRAVRCDKMTYAALEATLKLYLQNNIENKNTTFQMLTIPVSSIEERAKRLQSMISPINDLAIELESSFAQTGSGALPLEKIKSKALAISSPKMNAEKIAKHFRTSNPPIMGYVKNDKFYLDMRTVKDEELDSVANAINTLEDIC